MPELPIDGTHRADALDSLDEPTYKILRFQFDGPTTVVRTGLSLTEAQAHCNDPATRGDGWFDGYEEE